MSQTYTVLSPWAKSDYLVKYPITPRLCAQRRGLPANFETLAEEYRQELGHVDS